MIYSESINKLKAVLSAMHTMSQKRENLEKKLRFKLEREIRCLREERERERREGGGGGEGEGPDGEGREESVIEKLAELQLQNAALEADVVKVKKNASHTCNQHVGQQLSITPPL